MQPSPRGYEGEGECETNSCMLRERLCGGYSPCIPACLWHFRMLHSSEYRQGASAANDGGAHTHSDKTPYKDTIDKL